MYTGCSYKFMSSHMFLGLRITSEQLVGRLRHSSSPFQWDEERCTPIGEIQHLETVRYIVGDVSVPGV